MRPAQLETAQFDVLQPLKQPLDQFRKGPGSTRAFQKILATRRLPSQTNPGLAPGIFQEPGIQFVLNLDQVRASFRGIRSDNQELACGVDDLAGSRQIERFQHSQRCTFAEQRDVERPTAQQLGGAFLRLAASSENEVLNPEAIALNQ